MVLCGCILKETAAAREVQLVARKHMASNGAVHDPGGPARVGGWNKR